MRLRTIFIVLITLVLLYVIANYLNIEFQTSINIKKLSNVAVPEEISDPVYKRIFGLHDTDAKLLFKLKNSDLVFVYFTREPGTSEIVSTASFGEWEFDYFTYARQKSTHTNIWFWPPYF